MADDIQSSFKELVGNASREKSDFKFLAILCVGIVVGLFIGYSMNLENAAQIIATKDCGICQANLNTMVSNFNVLARTCNEAKQYQRNISILPGIINQTVSVYAS
jgi:F0F1-type ATP synthase assembly protein I